MMLLEGFFQMSPNARANVRITIEKKQKESSHEGIKWSEMGMQNVQAKEVYWPEMRTYTIKHLHLKFNLQFIEHKIFVPSCCCIKKKDCSPEIVQSFT